MKRISAGLCVALLIFHPIMIQADIISTTHQFTVQTHPHTAVPNTRTSFQTDQIQVFVEKQGVVVPKGIPGIKEGTHVDSYLIHYDPDLRHRTNFVLYREFRPTAVIVFSTQILAVYNEDINLNRTDTIFGLSIDYPKNLYYRGTSGINESGDRFSISGNKLKIQSLFVRDSATEPGTDQLRVITESSLNISDDGVKNHPVIN